jgi:hypothetical protein
MTAGLPGAGIGGLFYLASALLLPARSLARRLRGQPDATTWREQSHGVVIALGIIAGLWTAGWLLSFVIPADMRTAASWGPDATVATRTAIPLATLALGMGTLVVVLLAVEIAHRLHDPEPVKPRKRLTSGSQ